jgi:hypothetical protein
VDADVTSVGDSAVEHLPADALSHVFGVHPEMLELSHCSVTDESIDAVGLESVTRACRFPLEAH